LANGDAKIRAPSDAGLTSSFFSDVPEDFSSFSY